jgi:phosphotransferase system enzyme I (PtsI)
MKVKPELLIRGKGVVEGIVLGKANVYSPEKTPIPRVKLKPSRVHSEIERYTNALLTVKSNIQKSRHKTLKNQGSMEADILQSHILIAEDPFFTEEVTLQISQKRRNAEWVLMEGLKSLLKSFRAIDNLYFKERAGDIEDVTLSIIRQLCGPGDDTPVRTMAGILIVDELIPSLIMHIDTSKIKGLIADSGSETAHATILAKSLGIPVIINALDATRRIQEGQFIIMDGGAGSILLEPDEKLIKEYRRIQNDFQNYQKALRKTAHLPAETTDGVRVTLNANIEIVHGAELALHYGAEGVGLFRTELPFIIQNRLLTEDEQLKIYKTLLGKFKKRPVTVRTLDVGGDKFFPFQHSSFLEPNPFLGLRSTRVSLQQPDVFRTQIRALLKASAHGTLRILVPMISCYEEMTEILEMIEEEKQAARRDGVPFDENIKVGSMIEIPSAAIMAECLMELCDFLSIGTNDLVQYTLAVDRTNERVASFYIPENPAVLRLIDTTARAAVSAGKPCSVCGELAGNPLFTPFFLGVGIRELSMEPKFIPEAKRYIRSLSGSEARSAAEQLLACRRAREIKEVLQDLYNKHDHEGLMQ